MQGGLRVAGAVSMGNLPLHSWGWRDTTWQTVPEGCRQTPLVGSQGARGGGGPSTKTALLGFQKQLHVAPDGNPGSSGDTRWGSQPPGSSPWLRTFSGPPSTATCWGKSVPTTTTSL